MELHEIYQIVMERKVEDLVLSDLFLSCSESILQLNSAKSAEMELKKLTNAASFLVV